MGKGLLTAQGWQQQTHCGRVGQLRFVRARIAVMMLAGRWRAFQESAVRVLASIQVQHLGTQRPRIARWPRFSVGTLGRARFRAADAVNDALPLERAVTHGRRSLTASAARKTISQAVGKGGWKSRQASPSTPSAEQAFHISRPKFRSQKKDTA